MRRTKKIGNAHIFEAVFTRKAVKPTGSVEDIAIVESSSMLFERAAIESAAKYKYKPREIDGHAITVPGVVSKLVFELEDEDVTAGPANAAQ